MWLLIGDICNILKDKINITIHLQKSKPETKSYKVLGSYSFCFTLFLYVKSKRSRMNMSFCSAVERIQRIGILLVFLKIDIYAVFPIHSKKSFCKKRSHFRMAHHTNK